jgi:hypothetical protein
MQMDMQQIVVIAAVVAAAAYMTVRAIRHLRAKNKCGCSSCPMTKNAAQTPTNSATNGQTSRLK